MTIQISYPLSLQSPLYPGTPPFTCEELKSIRKGDSANTSLISLSSHTGTHIDASSHFCPNGKTTKDILGEKLEISPVYCIDIPVNENKAIKISDIQSYLGKIADAKGLLIRTGFYKIRAMNPDKYCSDHPWIHPELPQFLRIACPKIQLFGVDTISISNPQHREDGRQCHRAFLCGEFSLIVAEDLDLSNPELVTVPLRVIIYPWIVDDLDGVPVLAFAEPANEKTSRKSKAKEKRS